MTSAIAAVSAWLFWSVVHLGHSWAPGETQEDFEARLGTITTAAATAAAEEARGGRGWTTRELALAVLVIKREETQLDARLHAGLPHPVWHSDHGRAKCLGQVHRSGLVPESEWAELAGTTPDRTLACARATTRILVAQAKHCGLWWGQRASRDGLAKVLAAYGSGGNCTPTRSSEGRADKWQALIARTPELGLLKGYRRTVPAEAPPELLALGEGLAVGEAKHVEHEGEKYALVAERRKDAVRVRVLVPVRRPTARKPSSAATGSF